MFWADLERWNIVVVNSARAIEKFILWTLL